MSSAFKLQHSFEPDSPARHDVRNLVDAVEQLISDVTIHHQGVPRLERADVNLHGRVCVEIAVASKTTYRGENSTSHIGTPSEIRAYAEALLAGVTEAERKATEEAARAAEVPAQ